MDGVVAGERETCDTHEEDVRNVVRREVGADLALGSGAGGLRSCDPKLSAEDIACGCRQLLEGERG